MSFILDAPLLVLLGFFAVYLHQTRLRKRNEDALAFLSVAILALFWGVSVPLYLGLLPNLFLPQCGDGPTFIWNSCLPLGVAPGPGMWPLALLLFLSYPLWYAWGVERGRRAFGRRAGQEGVLWIFKPEEEADFGSHRKAWGGEGSKPPPPAR
ncbi:MAG: hypothetical protein QXO51_00920 [Halobacteria archaeon]